MASKLFVAAALFFAACTPDVCARNSDCNGGLVCSSLGACEVAPPDAATTDGGTDGATDGGTDGATDGGTDAVGDAGSDAMPDAATDAATDATIDASPDADPDGP